MPAIEAFSAPKAAIASKSQSLYSSEENRNA
jgi:hypothetical protein